MKNACWAFAAMAALVFGIQVGSGQERAVDVEVKPGKVKVDAPGAEIEAPAPRAGARAGVRTEGTRVEGQVEGRVDAPGRADDRRDARDDRRDDRRDGARPGARIGARVGGRGNMTWRSTQLVGLQIKDNSGAMLGKVEDFVVDANGCILYATVSYSGVEDRWYAVPYRALRIQGTEPSSAFVQLNVDRAMIQKAPSFTINEWPNFADAEFTSQVDRFYLREGADIGVDADVRTRREGADVDVDVNPAPRTGTRPGTRPGARTEGRVEGSIETTPVPDSDAPSTTPRTGTRTGDAPSTEPRASGSTPRTGKGTKSGSGASGTSGTGTSGTGTSGTSDAGTSDAPKTTEEPKANP